MITPPDQTRLRVITLGSLDSMVLDIASVLIVPGGVVVVRVIAEGGRTQGPGGVRGERSELLVWPG